MGPARGKRAGLSGRERVQQTGVIAEVKRNERKISLSALEQKIAALPSKEFGSYHFQLQSLSLKDI